MKSSGLQSALGILVALLAISLILIKFDKMPGVHLNRNLNSLKFGNAPKDDAPEADSGPGDGFRLGGLSSVAGQRLVIINNQTLAVGEGAKVEVKGKKVRVVCKEIRSNSAVLEIEGVTEPVEIFLQPSKTNASTKAIVIPVPDTNRAAASSASLVPLK